mgnify:CR=1 FL=1
MTDQHRLSAVGAYGPTPCRTPNIDRLAAEGVLFERAYTVCPVCSPARGTILTGLYPHGHGVTTNIHEIGCSVHELPDQPGLLPRRLQAAGYAVGYTGKWHLGTDLKQMEIFPGANAPSLPSTIGFEGQDFPGHGGYGCNYPQYKQWLAARGLAHRVKPWDEPTPMVRHSGILDVPANATVPAYLVDCSIEMIERFTARRQPFFIALNFWGPHEPYYATQEFVDAYRGVAIPEWPEFRWASRQTPGPHHMKIHPGHETTPWEHWETIVRYYYAATSMLDQQIGRLYAYLQKTGRLENTVIVFTADHGESLGSHGGLVDKGWRHFEDTHRIPFILRLPDGAGAGTRRPELVSLADVYPTVLDLAGASWDRGAAHGRSLLPLLNGDAAPWREGVVTEFLGLGNVGTFMKTVRMGSLKYGCNMPWADELYDLETDPHETRNLIDDPAYAGAIVRMRRWLEEWMRQTNDPALRMYRWRYGRDLAQPGGGVPAVPFANEDGAVRAG